MTTFRKKYRLFSSAISLLLVNFLLFSPYFHHHHDDAFDQVEETVIHSHLLNHNTDKHNSEDKDHFSIDENYHDHFIQLNSAFNINPSRGFKTNIVSNFYTSQFYFQDNTEKEESRNATSDPESQFQWEKYVHCAANVSPPLV